ncbi:MAG: ATP-binding protein, partial [Acidobacteriota bacterium]
VHIQRDWAHHPVYSFEQYTEIFMYIAVAVLAGYMSLMQRRARERLEMTARDLSEAYKKLNETFDQLRHSDRLASLGQLSAGIAHEIRNPLGSVQGAVEILSRGLGPDDPKTEFAEIARREVARLDKLVAEILLFSRPAPPRPVPCDLREIIEAACRLCVDRARHPAVEIIRNLDATVPPVLVDPEQIKQVLLNVLLNALQAQPDGGEVLVRAFEDSGEAVITVRDSGPGIDPGDLERIFDPFFTTRTEGTGLGLSISYQLVRNNGGRIRVASLPGEGACFSISFPAADKEDSG